MVEIRTLDQAIALLDEWMAASAEQQRVIAELSERVNELELDLQVADARLTVERLKRLMPRRRSPFDEELAA